MQKWLVFQNRKLITNVSYHFKYHDYLVLEIICIFYLKFNLLVRKDKKTSMQTCELEKKNIFLLTVLLDHFIFHHQLTPRPQILNSLFILHQSIKCLTASKFFELAQCGRVIETFFRCCVSELFTCFTSNDIKRADTILY